MIALLATAVLAFTNTTDAAVDALNRAYTECDHTSECGGFIMEFHGVFIASGSVSSGKPFANPAMGDLYAALDHAGFKMVADWHTHVCSVHNKPFANFFSPADVGSNDGLHLTGYMLSLCDKNIRMYMPGYTERDDEEVDFKSGKVFYLTTGNLIGPLGKMPDGIDVDEDQ